MKRFMLLLFALIFLLPPTVPEIKAGADTLDYAVAADSNVWFYTAEDESSRLFLLPETYYVRILLRGETYTAVSYLVNDEPYRQLMGYCRTDALTFVNFIPARPYLKRLVTIAYTLPDDGGYASSDFYGVERTFVYYGKRYENGQLYYYVLSDGKYGFLPMDAELEYERNDDWLYAPSIPSDGDNVDTTSDTGTPSVVQIVCLCLISVAAVVIAVLVLRGKKPTPPEDNADA